MTEAIYNQSSILYGGIVFPISIIIIALQWRVEYRNNSILLLCFSPLKLGKIYISKVISTSLLVLINAVIYMFIILLFSNMLLPNGEIPSYFYYSPLIAIAFTLPLLLIQHLLSIVTKNFIIPIGIGIIVTFGGFILNSSKLGLLLPNIYTFYGLFFNVPQTTYGNQNILFIIVPIISILLLPLGTVMFKNIER